MKRSEINKIIKNMERLIKKEGYKLPPFCNWSVSEWNAKGKEYQEIKDNMLGWDITDFGLNNFKETGFALLTLRNGNQKDEKYTKPYAEKLLMLEDGQKAPMHFHWNKMEDIINRGGGNVFIIVYNSTPEEGLGTDDVRVLSDGREYYVPAGTRIKLTPGMSITIYQGLYHAFEAEKGTGAVLLGEVSMCNDDTSDNRFYEPIGRFPDIEEDEEPYRLLCNEYPEALG